MSLAMFASQTLLRGTASINVRPSPTILGFLQSLLDIISELTAGVSIRMDSSRCQYCIHIDGGIVKVHRVGG